jgi:Antirepressor regulating drug resistance, predicted signal transduction N-terminal membrane component
MGMTFAVWFCFMASISVAFAAANRLLSKYIQASTLSIAWLIIAVAWMLPFRPTWSQASQTSGVVNGEQISNSIWDSILIILACFWIAGTLFGLAKITYSHIALTRYISRWGKPVTNIRTINKWKAACAELKKPPEILEIPEINSPMVTGIIRIKLLIPHGSSPSVLVMRHEAAHVSRFDTTRRLVLQLFQAVQWWNPFMHVAVSKAIQTSEVACDQYALRGQTSENRFRYAQAILDGTAGNKRFALAAPFTKQTSAVKHRLGSALDEKDKHKGAALIAALSLLFAGIGVPIAVASSPQSDAPEAPLSTPSNTSTPDTAPTPLPEPSSDTNGSLNTTDPSAPTTSDPLSEDSTTDENSQHQGSSRGHQTRMHNTSEESATGHKGRQHSHGSSSMHSD